MRRPLLGQQQAGPSFGSGLSNKKTLGQAAPAAAPRLLPRSQRYLAAIQALDTGEAGGVDVSEVTAAVLDEFGPGLPRPIGLLARCYLGAPFEVHVLDLEGEIVEHYEASRPLPASYARARQLALHPAYLAIEVYPDRLVCLLEDGSAVEVDGD